MLRKEIRGGYQGLFVRSPEQSSRAVHVECAGSVRMPLLFTRDRAYEIEVLG